MWELKGGWEGMERDGRGRQGGEKGGKKRRGELVEKEKEEEGGGERGNDKNMEWE